VPGYDLAGEIIEAPSGSGLTPGMPVFGMVEAWCAGTCADQVVVPVTGLAPKPESLTMIEAAALPLVSLTAIQALRGLARLRSGQTVCINGASGGVGTVAVQIARALGAEVTGVCSGRNTDLVRSLGSHHVIDYTEQHPLATGRYHVFFDAFGNLSFGQARQALESRGIYISTVPGARIFVDSVLSRLGRQRAHLVIVRDSRTDLDQICTWVDQGLLRPVIDRVLPLESSAEAHTYLETRRARGKVVLDLMASVAVDAPRR
jgi:NADPH:quinone reductase-like Zn-dependent oxidoreductase